MSTANSTQPATFTFTNTLLHGDCRDVLSNIPAGSVDLIVTDPPYIARYCSRDGRSILNDASDDWLLPAFTEAHRVLREGRFMVCFYGWPKAERFLGAWRAAGFRVVGHVVFVKGYASSRRLVDYRHEMAYLLAKGDAMRPVQRIADVLPWRYTGNRWHPTEKPVCALRPLIEAFSWPNDLVLDPFAGSASTLVAARQLGRRYFGIELDADYHRLATRRLAEGAS